MPYKPMSQRYTETPVSPTGNNTDVDLVKMGRSRARAAEKVNRTPFQQRRNLFSLPNRPASPAPVLDYGFRRDPGSGGTSWPAQFGFTGYAQAGYPNFFYSPYQAQSYQEQAHGGTSYGGSFYGGNLAGQQPPATFNPMLYPATSASQGSFYHRGGQYNGQEQYVPSKFQYQFQPHAHYGTNWQPPAQSGLTQQWRTAYGSEPPPPPPPASLSPPPPPPPPAEPADGSAFSRNAPPFRPKQPILKSVRDLAINRPFCIDKKHRFSSTNFAPHNIGQQALRRSQRPVEVQGSNLKPSAGPWAGRARQAAKTQQPKSFSQPVPQPNAPTGPKSKRSSSPIKYALPRPKPSPEYIAQANEPRQTLRQAKELLTVLDLNGTLLHRRGRATTTFDTRPLVHEFLHYLFSNHKVIVWSSAMPENVTTMCGKLLSKEQNEQLVACWGRDKLAIPQRYYRDKVQVYKRLTFVWNDKRIQATHPDSTKVYGQDNTVLLDDSVEKAASEPFNLIQLEEFENRPEQRERDVLGQVVRYLETLRWEKDVSTFMRCVPFMYDPEQSFDWNIVR